MSEEKEKDLAPYFYRKDEDCVTLEMVGGAIVSQALAYLWSWAFDTLKRGQRVVTHANGFRITFERVK